MSCTNKVVTGLSLIIDGSTAGIRLLRESLRGLAPPVPEVDDLREGLRLDEFEVESLRQWREVRGAATQHDGSDEQPVLIDEVFLGKGGGEPGTADGHDASAGLILQLGDLVSDGASGQAGVTFHRSQAG